MEWSSEICSNTPTVNFLSNQTANKMISCTSVGLIEARVVGARTGAGDVIVVLDAHCECVRSFPKGILCSVLFVPR